MVYLFENSLGYYLFKETEMEPELLNSYKFKGNEEMLSSFKQLINNEIPDNLLEFLKTNVTTPSELVVCDNRYKEGLSALLEIPVKFSSDRIFNVIRGLVSTSEENLKSSTLFLAHKIACEKVNLSGDKLDTMVTQSINLLMDLDKDINMHCMRLREWYGFHFPEVSSIVEDNMVYVKVVNLIGDRGDWNDNMVELSESLTEIASEYSDKIISLMGTSMGSEISIKDIHNIKSDCVSIIKSFEYRKDLVEYIKSKMNILAPNISALLGEIMGARFVSKAGSIDGLSKLPSSTIQILGAEKSLFQALRKNGNTPKYGIIYESSLVGQASPQFKGKVARTLASKIALCARIDATGESTGDSFGKLSKSILIKRIKALEDRITAKKKKSKKGKFILNTDDVLDYTQKRKKTKTE